MSLGPFCFYFKQNVPNPKAISISFRERLGFSFLSNLIPLKSNNYFLLYTSYANKSYNFMLVLQSTLLIFIDLFCQCSLHLSTFNILLLQGFYGNPLNGSIKIRALNKTSSECQVLLYSASEWFTKVLSESDFIWAMNGEMDFLAPLLWYIDSLFLPPPTPPSSSATAAPSASEL